MIETYISAAASIILLHIRNPETFRKVQGVLFKVAGQITAMAELMGLRGDLETKVEEEVDRAVQADLKARRKSSKTVPARKR